MIPETLRALEELLAGWREDVAAERKLSSGAFFAGGTDMKEACANELAEVLALLAERSAERETEDFQIAIGALADIGWSEDMTLILAQRKARRIYETLVKPAERETTQEKKE